jgi:hypothetical protein
VTDDLDSLFAAAPADFIEERKRIVAALKDAGRKDEAKAVEKIPRPSLALWTVNQIARRDPELVQHLGRITQRLQSATGPDYAAAAVEHRQALQQLRERATDVLADAGQEAAPHVVQRVIANLRSAAGSAETRGTLEQGRLERDVEETDGASLFGTMVAADAPDGAEPAAATTPETTAAPPAKAAPAITAAEAKAQERARAKAAAAAEREARRLRDAEASARKEVDRTERAVAAARQSLTLAEVRAASARAAADAAAEARAQAESGRARASTD